MKRFPFMLAIGGLTFILGVTAAALWTIKHPSRNNQKPADQVSVDAIVGLCDLIRSPDRFESQDVRVDANLIGYHEIGLYGAACKEEANYVRADFDGPSRGELVQGISRLNGAGLHRGNFWAHVILSGRFEKLPKDLNKPRASDGDRELIEFRYRLMVSGVQKVAAVSDDVPWW